MRSGGLTGFGVSGIVAVLVCAALAADEQAPKRTAAKPAAANGAVSGAAGYSGTFSDTSGRKGPLACQVTQGAGDKWTLKFSGKNEGQGPNKPYECGFDLPGKKDGTSLNLSGTNDLGRTGQFEVTITVTDKTLEGKFKKADGKNSGNFSMTPAKSAP